ncbi:MAG: leucine-rich repeat domain-containing protein [Lachnospiraceae bacterium]|nr:leucine-rich repeat domain-containing protein [Lachnospiraceae bacterium]
MKRTWKTMAIACVGVLLASQLSSLQVKADNQWSEWSTVRPDNSNEYQVEQRTVYRYRDKQFVTSSAEKYNGWTRDDSKTRQVWSSWSDWQDAEVTDSDTRIVKTRSMYHYRDKKTTTSTNSTLSGWTKYDTKTTWGSWSAWTDTAVGASATRNVQTQQVQTRAGYTQYRYGRWNNANNTYWHFCQTCAVNQRGGSWHVVYTPWMNSPITSYDTGQYCNHGYSYKNDGQKTYNYYNGSKKEHYYWQETQNVAPTYKTQYRYQDATITYYYYQWDDWSEWSTSAETATDNRQVEDKTQYSYREETPVYTYYRWNDWTDYSVDKPDETQDREVEEQVQYRYCRVEATTTEQPTIVPTQPTPSQPDTVTVGKATIVPVDSQTEDKDVTDSSVKQGNNKNNTVGKGTILVSKKGTYRITNTKKKTVEYAGVGKKKETSVVIPSEIKFKMKRYKVTAIAANAFRNNKKIKSVKIGNSVCKIGNSAFRGCSKLQSVYMGKNVEKIGNYAFYKCKNLSEVTIRSEKVNQVGKCAFKKIDKKPTIKIMRRMISKYNKLFKHKM